jgi:hypothetical protein
METGRQVITEVSDKTADEQRNGKQNIEALLAEGHTIQLHPNGYSMYPLFVPGRDEAVIAPIKGHTPRRGDVLLYRRDHGILVLHRICKVTKQGIYFVGDNQTEVEGPLRPDQLRGIMTAFIRKGKRRETANPVYVCVSRVWLLLRPVRRPIQKAGHALLCLFRR